MKTFKSARLKVFAALIVIGGACYLVDCSVVSLFKTHPELSCAYSSDREQSFHAMVNGARSG